MSVEIVTKEDLEILRITLLDDIRQLLKTVAQSPAKENDWLKSGEVRKLLKASPGTLQNLRISGKLHPIKIAGTWYYDRKEINTLFDKSK